MKRLVIFLFFALFCNLGISAQENAESPLAGFEWLLGKWERMNSRQGQVSYESWTKESDIKFTGFGWTMKGNDTIFSEKLSLVIKDADIYYVADVTHNLAPTFFKIIAQSGNSFMSANPDHDFPKKIEYKLDGENILIAVISGDGREIPYMFKKAR